MASLNLKIQAVCNEPGCDKNQGKSEKERKKDLPNNWFRAQRRKIVLLMAPRLHFSRSLMWPIRSMDRSPARAIPRITGDRCPRVRPVIAPVSLPTST